MPRVKRCEFITLIGGAAAWSIAARAQQGERMRRIGVLLPAPADDAEFQTRVGAFLQDAPRWPDMNVSSRIDGLARSSTELCARPSSVQRRRAQMINASNSIIPIPITSTATATGS